MKKPRGNNIIETTPELLSIVDMFHSHNKDDYDLAVAILKGKSRRVKNKIHELIMKDSRNMKFGMMGIW